jgi:hypothetical protein
MRSLQAGAVATAARQATNDRRHDEGHDNNSDLYHTIMARMKGARQEPESRVIAEETTTLPEGTVLSVYRIRVGKLGHQVTKLVALHNNMKRVEMTVDNIAPHNLRFYLQLTQREIERQRKKLTTKPMWTENVSPKTTRDFVLSMAFNDMFIFEALTNNNMELGSDADKPEPTKKVVSRRRKAKKLPQVLPDSDGTVHGSGTTKTDS